jgi:hypothetical protein
MTTEKNPLRAVFIVVCILLVVYIFQFSVFFKETHDINGVIRNDPEAVIGFLISICFFFAYLKRLIHAWWIALIATPLTFIAYYTVHPFITKDLYGIGVALFVFGYLMNYYEPYKKFIDHCEDPGFQDSGTIKSDKRSEQNPMRYLAVAGVGLLGFDLIFYGGVFIHQGMREIITNHIHRVVQTVLLSAFLASYQCKSIVAWWIGVLWGPLVWILFGQSHPFNMFQFFWAGIIWICILVYMIRIYSKYLVYICKA